MRLDCSCDVALINKANGGNNDYNSGVMENTA